MKKALARTTAVLAAIAMLVACVAKPTAGPSYYLLSSVELSSQALDLKPFKLALGPVDLPGYLDREGIVSHEGQNQLLYSNNHRWAEPLKVNLLKAIYADMAQLLPNQQLIDFPYRQSNRPDYQLSVSIEKFGYVNDGSVVLKARSVLMDSSGRQLDSTFVDLGREQPEKDHAEIVSQMSHLLGEMAVSLANRISEKT